MEKTITARGFDLIVFTDRYGSECTLQKSSLASEDCIWFGVDKLEPKVLHGDARKLGIQHNQNSGWVDYQMPKEVQFNNRMHLTRKQVKDLLPILKKFVKHGEIA